MIKTTRKSTVVLVGLFALPTSSKFHAHEPSKCSAFKPGQEAFILKAVDEDGYPARVVMTADEGDLYLSLGEEVDTQHAQVRKNLPKRFVEGIVRADGSFEGEIPPKGLGLPHWEYIPTDERGAANLSAVNAVAERIESNRQRAEEERARVKALKEQTRGANKAA
jgi:hypothetical protein